MLRYSKSATVVLLHLFLLCLGTGNAAPTIPGRRDIVSALRVARADDNLSQSTTVQTTNTLQTSVGTMIETCTITLDPITGDNGEPLVRESKSCTVTMASNNASNPQSSDSGATTTSSADSSQTTDASATSSADGSQSTDASATSSADGSQSTDASATSSADSSQSTDASASSSSAASDASSTSSAAGSDSGVATSTSSGGGAISTGTVSVVPGSSLQSGATGTDAATATATASGSDSASASGASATAAPGSGKAISPGGFSTIASSVVATESIDSAAATATAAPTGSAAPSGSAAADAADAPSSASSAADNAQTSAAKFQLPGTQLSVLPIGLGVFAGISAIALIVVGLVTYERTKYRKAFRQRKLAESGASMGYGGMAQAA
ncbi:hypothetical protein C8Q80DRAFT_830843 [Daedaleopsis nitida]|nr:hypothetical protein C8Q80DRAFT_830843 [Daedaleopsis nitida]